MITTYDFKSRLLSLALGYLLDQPVLPPKDAISRARLLSNQAVQLRALVSHRNVSATPLGLEVQRAILDLTGPPCPRNASVVPFVTANVVAEECNAVSRFAEIASRTTSAMTIASVISLDTLEAVGRGCPYQHVYAAEAESNARVLFFPSVPHPCCNPECTRRQELTHLLYCTASAPVTVTLQKRDVICIVEPPPPPSLPPYPPPPPMVPPPPPSPMEEEEEEEEEVVEVVPPPPPSPPVLRRSARLIRNR